MQTLRRNLFAGACCLLWLSASVFAQDTFLEPSSMKSFPKQVTFDHDGKAYTLKATGATEQRKLKGENVKSFMTLAHYMETPPSAEDLNAAATVLKDKGAKQITINLNIDFPDSRLQRMFQKRLNLTGAAKLQASITEFYSCFAGSLAADTRCVVRWLPDGKTQILVPGQPEKLITNTAFAPLFWKAWFEENTLINSFELVSLWGAW